MNYIKHLSSFYSHLDKIPGITPHDISLYIAIFQTWNAFHFKNPIHVNREELMKLSKIGSVNTYIRCLKELDNWSLIRYEPSRNISVGSCIRMITFDKTSDNRTGNTSDKTSDSTTDNRSDNTGVRHEKPTLQQAEDFFSKENYDAAEASSFYNHYQANGWMMGSVAIQNWQAAAINWMSKIERFNSVDRSRPPLRKTMKPKPGNLAVTTGKKYDEPL